MASAQSTLPIPSDRADIHKACKSLETLVNTLNDYCEAASAIIALQKKLTKALRDTASLKLTAKTAASALSASATIFDVKSDIDTKFGKLADKECDNISSEVRKWFKKLAKEEKAHDEKIDASNARIKQAGQSYERKSKKNTRDAAEEHARYIYLISTLGPEISQDKYDHAISVTQKHTSATLGVAGCLARIADMEWVRSCEEVRRFSPTVGILGESRSLCEGGWTGNMPTGLPGGEEKRKDESPGMDNLQANPRMTIARAIERQDSKDTHMRGDQPMQDDKVDPRNATDVAPPPSSWNTAPYSDAIMSRKVSNANIDGQDTALEPPRLPFLGSSKWQDSVGSVASLSAFPSPPNHVPDGPVLTPPTSSSEVGKFSESPKSYRDELPSTGDSHSSQATHVDHGSTSGTSSAPSSGYERRSLVINTTNMPEPNTQTFGKASTGGSPAADPIRSQTTVTRAVSPQSPTRPLPHPHANGLHSAPNAVASVGVAPIIGIAPSKSQGDYLADEFGVNRAVPQQSAPRTERNGSTSSIVAAMRNRYSSAPGSSSPPPRDIPRLPLSVNDLASKYQPLDDPVSPRARVVSPIPERSPQKIEVVSPRPSPYPQERSPDGGYIRFPSPSTEANMEELARRRRQKELEQAQALLQDGLREQERDQCTSQYDFDTRTQALERDRAQFTGSRIGDRLPINPTTEQQYIPAENSHQQRRYLQLESPGPAISRNRYSYSTTHLVPPSGSTTHLAQSHPSLSQPPSPAGQYPFQPTDHAESCGCEKCSASKYRHPSASASSWDLRPPEPPINLRPEKSSKPGWIRRLSMPGGVANAFSLDSKKSSSTLRATTGTIPTEEGRIRRSFEQGGISNRSSTNLGKR